MYRHIKKYVQGCQVCQENKINRIERAPMVLTDTLSKLFAKVYIDMVGPFPLSSRGNMFALTAQDFICAAMTYASAETAARTFFEFVIARSGMPKMLVSDNGRNFVAELMKEL